MTMETVQPLEEARPALGRLRAMALVVGVVALGAWGAGAFFNPDAAMRSYLVAFMLVTALALGSLVVLMLHNLTGGGWGFAIRRIVEAGSATLPLAAVMFIPVALGVGRLYEWSHAGYAVGAHKSHYLTVNFWIARSVGYFVVWIGMGMIVNAMGRRLEKTRDPRLSGRLQNVSALGLVVYGITITMACVDWVMSIDAHWFSTIFGMMFMVGQTLTALLFAVVMLRVLATRRPLAEHLTKETFNDLGSLMLTFVILWTYMAFVQYLVIWSGNLKEEVVYYVQRTHTWWKWVALGMVTFHFFVPFFLLLNRPIKRDIRALAWVAGMLLAMRVVDYCWFVAPSYESTGAVWGYLYVAGPVGLGGIWMGYFVTRLMGRDLVPAFGHPVRKETSDA